MDHREAQQIVKHAQKPQFGAAHQIAADRFLAEARVCAEWLMERSQPVMLAGLRDWFTTLDSSELQEIENLVWMERRSRRHA